MKRARLINGLVVAAAAATILGGAGAASAVTSQLTIKVDNGSDGVTAASPVTYQVTVQNSGVEAAPIRIMVDAPAGMKDLSADADGRVSPKSIEWTTTVEPGASSQVSVTGTFAKVPAEHPRIALTACVYVGDATSPMICSTDIDTVAAAGIGAGWWTAGAALLLVAAGAGGAFLFVRRRRVAVGSRHSKVPAVGEQKQKSANDEPKRGRVKKARQPQEAKPAVVLAGVAASTAAVATESNLLAAPEVRQDASVTAQKVVPRPAEEMASWPTLSADVNNDADTPPPASTVQPEDDWR